LDFNGPKIQIKTFSFILVTQCGNNLCFEYNYSKLQSSTFFLIKIICVTFLGDIGKQYSWSVCSHSSAIMRLTLTNEKNFWVKLFTFATNKKVQFRYTIFTMPLKLQFSLKLLCAFYISFHSINLITQW
jgi:hypothetical protein